MKRLLFITVLLLSLPNIFGQKNIYENFGTWEIVEGTNKVSICGYITHESVKKTIVEPTYTKKIPQKTAHGVLEEKKKTQHIFELYLISKSIYNSDTTSTWINGVRIYINGVEVTKDQFPEGFLLSVATKPTFVYSYKTELQDSINMSLTWERAIYEPRIRK